MGNRCMWGIVLLNRVYYLWASIPNIITQPMLNMYIMIPWSWMVKTYILERDANPALEFMSNTLSLGWYPMSKATAGRSKTRAARDTRAAPAKKSSTWYSGTGGSIWHREPVRITRTIRTSGWVGEQEGNSLTPLNNWVTKTKWNNNLKLYIVGSPLGLRSTHRKQASKDSVQFWTRQHWGHKWETQMGSFLQPRSPTGKVAELKVQFGVTTCLSINMYSAVATPATPSPPLPPQFPIEANLAKTEASASQPLNPNGYSYKCKIIKLPNDEQTLQQ